MRYGASASQHPSRTRGRLTRPFALLGVAGVALLGIAASIGGTPAAQADHPQGFSPLAASVVAPPHPVRTTDGHRHLVYEIELTNVTARTVRVDRIVSRDRDTNRPLRSWVGTSSISTVMQKPAVVSGNPSVEPTDTLGPAEAGTAFLDVPLDRDDDVPSRLVHRVDMTVTPPPTGVVFDGKFRGVLPTPVIDERPVELARPLIGGRYLDANGCCGASPHTRALQVIDTTAHNSQRFAIDWIKLDAAGRYYHGDFDVNENHLIFGKPVVAVADATVVDTLDGLPENTPGEAASYDLDPSTALGNHVILDLGGGRYALYAHLETGSVGVQVGEQVDQGEVLARVGNTGNTTAPHLHFQVMDAPHAIAANGLPYVFDHFRLTGRVTNLEEVRNDLKPADVVPVPEPTGRSGLLPLQADVVNFGH
jgi:hypothetical protein